MSQPPPLGAPGVYERAAAPIRALTGVRMDVCAFAGVAPRGPARLPVVDEQWPDRRWSDPRRPVRRSVPVAVDSFDEYLNLYGGHETPGRLSLAVASFFEQGGRRAYVVRVVHRYGDERDREGVARATLGPLAGAQIGLRARNEGVWGDRLRARLSFRARPLLFEEATETRLVMSSDTPLAPGTLLRLELPGGAQVLRFVSMAHDEGRRDAPGRRRVATLDHAVSAVPQAVETVDATLRVDDGAGREERHEDLGLSPVHPRPVAAVLRNQSELVWPEEAWAEKDVEPATVDLPAADAMSPENPADPASPTRRGFGGGSDRYAAIVPDDFFHFAWPGPTEPSDEGVHSLADVEEVSLLVVPDLYSPAPPPDDSPILDDPILSGPEFARCLEPQDRPEQAARVEPLSGLQLDPRDALERAQVIELQQRLVEFADRLRSFVVLLDVPAGLHHRQILAWRSCFASDHAAAYHPWLRMARPGHADRTVLLPPSAAAAGIAARREQLFGVPFGPANELAGGVVDVDERVSPGRHAELHPNGVNVFLRERDGIRLSAARTLARDPAYRQLSVRRLMTMLRRALERQVAWAVFEPNDESLRATIRHALEAYLRQLFAANAFIGATEREAFFVRCDEELNPGSAIDAGMLVAEVGVAPAEPLEFLVLRIARDGDGALLVEEDGGA